MDLGVMLQVAIGLSLLYLMFSLFCTVANEALARVMNWRAANLAQGLARLVDDKDLKSQFDQHPLVGAVARAADGWGFTHIPSAIFAQALVDRVRVAGGLASGAVSTLDAAIAALPESTIKGVLTSLQAKATASATTLETELAVWFDASMVHVQEAYAKRMHAVSLAFGLMLAVAGNADTIRVASELWRQPTLRQAVVADAGSALANGIKTDEGVTMSQQDMAAALTNLPVGWDAGAKSYASAHWPLAILGWLLTAAAIALGAPFWFDLLSRFVNLGGTRKS